jgi:serine/threonine protein kinase
LKQEDPRLIGPYRPVGRLGSGGMGQVFLCLSAGGRPVAVKVIRAELAADQEFRVRFGREVAAARRVSGLFTALVVDADVDGPVPWLATAYVAGPSLARAVTDHGPMAVRPTLALAAGLAEGLSAIHAAGVVHCDLKPSNVLLSPDGPRVIDFGISRAAEAVSVTGVGWVVGSPGFMSPEQAMSEEVGPPSDVFSLGAVLTFAATGRGPFGRGSRPELAYRLVYSPPDLDLVPAELRPLVARCLAKDPGQRPTADEVLASAAQPAAGWLADTVGAFALSDALSAGPPVERSASERATPVPALPQDDAAMLGPGLRQPSGPSRPRSSRPRPSRPWRWWRPLAAAGATACVLTASIAVSLALSAPVRHLPALPLEPGAAAAPSTSTPEVPGTRPASARSTPVPRPKPAIVPDIDTVNSPGSPASHPPTVTPSATKSAPPSPSPTPTPSPSASASPSAPVPQITGVDTYRQGVWVYLDVHYADPGKDAEGFGFMGVNGPGWVEESYPFSAPGPGIVGPDSIAYPLDLECGTAWQHRAEVEVWISDTAGASSQPVVFRMACGTEESAPGSVGLDAARAPVAAAPA